MRRIDAILVVASTALLPTFFRRALRELIPGPITGAHVLVAQFALLVIVASLAAVDRRESREAVPARRGWAGSAMRLACAMALVLAGGVASGRLGITAVRLETVTLVLTAPIVEEIVFRGYMPELLAGALGRADRTVGRVVSAIVSSAAFAAAHAGGYGPSTAASDTLVVSFPCGLAFHLLRDASGGLTAPMAAHAGVNAMSLAATG